MSGTRSDQPYAHHYHAGNVGDVLKHAALVATLRGLVAQPAPLRVIDTHAGAGKYKLGPAGEWTAGIGRVDAGLPTDAPPALRDYAQAVAWRRVPDRGGAYPGSPAITHALLRPDDTLHLVELADAPRQELQAMFTGQPGVTVAGGDGFSALVAAATERSERRLFGLVDPPYSTKGEWAEVVDTLFAAWMARPDAAFMAWYPIKSHTRPNALKARLREHGLPASTIELLSTPFEVDRKRRKALNGSGVLLVNPPPGVVAALAAAGPALGRLLATREGAWTLTVEAWDRD